MEIWIIVLILVILLTAQLLYWIKSRGKVGNEKTAGFYFTPRGGLRAEVKANFRLAPRDPEVMAAVLYDLLSQRLSYQQMLAVCEFVASPEMTGRFIERLASRKDTSSLANQMAFLCNSMEANGFTPDERLHVSVSLMSRAKKEYKLRKIQKNLDKLF